MKVWIESVGNWLYDEENVKFAITWSRHSPLHKWKGFSLYVFIGRGGFCLTAVNNYAAYHERMNRRSNYVPKIKSKKTDT